MVDQVVVLITGASRGIGKGLLTCYVSRPNHTVIAGLRDPDSVSSKSLQNLPRGENSSIILVKLDSSSDTDAGDAVQTLSNKFNIKKIDVVIANAGISNYFGKAAVTPPGEMLDHFRINTIGPLLLFQAAAPLLQKATMPKFVVLSSGAGSLSNVDKLAVENTAYGASKAAVNFVTSFPINPGWLQTDLGNHAAEGAGMDIAPVTVEDGVAGLITQIDKATRQDTSGYFITYNGEQLPW